MSEAKHSPAEPVPASEALELIKKRLADLREANAIYRKTEWYRLDEIQRNDREIRWLVDLNTLLRLPAPEAADRDSDLPTADDVRGILGPAPEAAPTREEIAKIIDPDAKFEDIDGVQWSKFELQRRELAYQKADAILALKAAPHQRQGE